MSAQRTGQRTSSAVAPAPVAAPRGPRERRLRLWHGAAGVAMVMVGALASMALVRAAAPEGEYLAVTRDVAYAQRLSTSDLVPVRIADPPQLRPVAAGDVDRVVGLYAAVPLVAGTLLTPGQLTAQPIPGPGEHVVGVALRGDRLPAQRPEPGDRVLLVATEPDGEQTPDALAPTWPATVVGIAGGGGGGLLEPGRTDTVTLDVVVPVADGPAVARAAAANQLVVVLAGAGG